MCKIQIRVKVGLLKNPYGWFFGARVGWDQSICCWSNFQLKSILQSGEMFFFFKRKERKKKYVYFFTAVGIRLQKHISFWFGNNLIGPWDRYLLLSSSESFCEDWIDVQTKKKSGYKSMNSSPGKIHARKQFLAFHRIMFLFLYI